MGVILVETVQVVPNDRGTAHSWMTSSGMTVETNEPSRLLLVDRRVLSPEDLNEMGLETSASGGSLTYFAVLESQTYVAE